MAVLIVDGGVGGALLLQTVFYNPDILTGWKMLEHFSAYRTLGQMY